MRKDIHNSDIPVICQSCEARHRGICGALSPEQLIKLSKMTSRKLLKKNTVISHLDEQVDRFSNVIKGVAKLTNITPDGRQQIVGLQFAPDFLGRPFGYRSQVSTEAATDIELCSFPKATLENLIKENAELEHKLHEQALKQLDDAREWMLALGRKTASEKISFFLYWVAIHDDPSCEMKENVELLLPLSRTEIADFLGLTIETVSRQITKLRKSGLIDLLNTNTIIIKNMDNLASHADI